MGEILLVVLSVGLSFAVAVLHRALRSASPSRLEEINERLGRYRALPDLEDAAVASGAARLVSYSLLACSVCIFAGERLPASGFRPLISVAGAAAAIGACEAFALIAAGYHSGEILYQMLSLVGVLAHFGAAVHIVGGAVAGFLAKLAGKSAPPVGEEAAEEEMFDAVSEGEREGVIEDHQREMIESIIEFKDVEVSEIMTPRTDINSINADRTLREVLDSVVAMGHSRLPVWSDDADNIVGILYAKDILRHVTPDRLDDKVRDVMRPPSFVPETKMVRELLQEFRSTTIHMAVVLDEYGGFSGVVTIEDIIEEIVGEIEDEYDERTPPEVKKTGPRQVLVAGEAPVDDVAEALGLELTEGEEYETIAGYILYRTGRIPRVGETFEWEGAVFRIVEADERRVNRLLVEPALTIVSEPAEEDA
ncbi:MAG: hemolysin family protein [Planctomycetota bacterium]|jgi:magnesium and cobalt transporter